MLIRDGKIDLTQLRMTSGEGRSVDAQVKAPEFQLGGVDYSCRPDPLEVNVAMSRTVGDGWAFRISFDADVVGPCAKCLAGAEHHLSVQAREADRPGGGEELQSPYLDDGELDVTSWARDALILALPVSISCSADCRGLCDTCGERLSDLPDDHAHEKDPDPRWEALRRLGG